MDKRKVEAKTKFGKNPMGVHLSLIQVYIYQDPFPHTCQFSLDQTMAVTNKHPSYLLPHSFIYSFSQHNAIHSQNDTVSTQSTSFYCSPLHCFFLPYLSFFSQALNPFVMIFPLIIIAPPLELGNKYFKDLQDIALGLSTDGFGIFNCGQATA